MRCHTPLLSFLSRWLAPSMNHQHSPCGGLAPLKTQTDPTVDQGSWWWVEVRGVEPRSAEFFVSNSPSAATDWLSAGEITAAVSRRPIRDWLGPAVPESRQGHPALATPLSGGAGTLRRGRATYLSGGQRHLWFGTCFCLPGCFARFRKPRLASDTAITQRRIQVTPMPSRYRSTIQTPCDRRLWFSGPTVASNPRDGGPPDEFPSLSPGVARVRG